MKRGDLIWLAVLAAIAASLLVPTTHNEFVRLTKAHPYGMGFLKVAILATMGELLALRIVMGRWQRPSGLFWRSVVWGFLGITFVLMFDIFATGINGAVGKGLVFVGSGTVAKVATALWISAVMNLTFAPTMMAFHRVTDTFLDLAEGRLSRLPGISIQEVAGRIDWSGFVSFVVVKTIPLFWIPAHTITFVLPPEYRVLVAAFLSIALGTLLAFAKRKGSPAKSRAATV